MPHPVTGSMSCTVAASMASAAGWHVEVVTDLLALWSCSIPEVCSAVYPWLGQLCPEFLSPPCRLLGAACVCLILHKQTSAPDSWVPWSCLVTAQSASLQQWHVSGPTLAPSAVERRVSQDYQLGLCKDRPFLRAQEICEFPCTDAQLAISTVVDSPAGMQGFKKR